MRIIAGSVGGRRIESPPGQDLRPMMDKVRAALFDMLWHFEALDGRVLDLYAGSGAVGIEALSRGSRHTDFVELNPVSARTILRNLETLGLEGQGRVHRQRAEQVIEAPSRIGANEPYELVILTPPYHEVDYPELVGKLAASTLIGPGSVVVVEHPRKVELEDEIGPLQQLRARRYGGTRLSIYHVPTEDEEAES